MKVLALAADNGGCGFYRVRAPAAEAVRLGVDITVDDTIDVEATKSVTTGITEVTEVRADADLIIIQRPLDNAMTSLIRQAKRQGIATIVEIDDDFSTVHRKNIAHEHMHGSSSGHQWVSQAASEADHVTVSTMALTKYAPHGRYSILRNCVPIDIFKVEQGLKTEQEWPRIGWTGSVGTHPEDLQQTKGRIGRVLSDNGLPFNVVGDGDLVAGNLSIPAGTDVFSTGWVPLDEYYAAMASVIDIGIVPLEMSAFNQAKSALKGLEYASLGIPFVASPTREYELLALDGIGKLANTPGDWQKHIQRMIDRPSETERIGKEYRDRMEAEYTYRVHAPKWVEAWEKAIDYRKTHVT